MRFGISKAGRRVDRVDDYRTVGSLEETLIVCHVLLLASSVPNFEAHGAEPRDLYILELILDAGGDGVLFLESARDVLVDDGCLAHGGVAQNDDLVSRPRLLTHVFDSLLLRVLFFAVAAPHN